MYKRQAMGRVVTVASGSAWRTPIAMLAAASGAEAVPLNESGATTICMPAIIKPVCNETLRGLRFERATENIYLYCGW